MEINTELQLYNDGTDNFIKLDNIYPIVLCGINSYNEMLQEAKKGNKVELMPIVFRKLKEIGIETSFKTETDGN